METEDEWQLLCSDLKQRGAFLLKMGDWSDCTLVVGVHQIPMRAHKLILAMASPVFESLFFAESLGNTDTFTIPDVTPKAFTALLKHLLVSEKDSRPQWKTKLTVAVRILSLLDDFAVNKIIKVKELSTSSYIYTENINIQSFKQARKLYLAATKYMITQLACVCAEYLRWNLTLETACGTFQAAVTCQDETLMNESLQVIKLHIQELLHHKSFKDLDLETIVKIFRVEDLRITEMELFKALQRYVQAMGNRKRAAEGDEAESGLDTKTRQLVRNALQQIRFLTMSVDSFAQGPARSGLLSESDALAILLNLAGTSAPLPAGFCDSREPRLQIPKPPATPVIKPPSTTGVVRLRMPAESAWRKSALSEPVEVLGRPWRLRVIQVVECATATYASKNSYLGVFLTCASPEAAPWSCAVRVHFFLVARSPAVHKQWTMVKTYTSAQNEFGNQQFVILSVALAPASGYIHDGHLTFEAHISADPTAPGTSGHRS